MKWYIFPFIPALLRCSIALASSPNEDQIVRLENSCGKQSDGECGPQILISDGLDGHTRVTPGKNANPQRWMHDGKEYIREDNLQYELVSHPTLSRYQLRFTQPKLCDPFVQQYSGYFDIAEDEHLFFWFFESRTSPQDAPLLLLLSGGLGCSSSTGLLFELGPCRITDEGRNTVHNPYSWIREANIIFLDQPVNIGYSYADSGTFIKSSPVVAKDVHAFLQLFLKRFPQYSSQPFHVAGESYGGNNAPSIAKVIHDANKQLARSPIPGLKHINLESVILGNGATDPYTQVGSVAGYVCKGPYPIYDNPHGEEYARWQNFIAWVDSLVHCCELGLNPYDVRMRCDDRTDHGLGLPVVLRCYNEKEGIEIWMNNPDNRAALGVKPDRAFVPCNSLIYNNFALQGDRTHNNWSGLLSELINDGIRLLVYTGNSDVMYNYIGNERWLERLETRFSQDFKDAKSLPWVTLETSTRTGEVRTAGGGGTTAGNITFVKVYNSGHMVPYDQPEAALDLIARWLKDMSLTSS